MFLGGSRFFSYSIHHIRDGSSYYNQRYLGMCVVPRQNRICISFNFAETSIFFQICVSRNFQKITRFFKIFKKKSKFSYEPSICQWGDKIVISSPQKTPRKGFRVSENWKNEFKRKPYIISIKKTINSDAFTFEKSKFLRDIPHFISKMS